MPRVHSCYSQVGKNNSDSESDKESETKMEEDCCPNQVFVECIKIGPFN